jgi:heme oxygenase (mycobilin-producing)
MIRVVLEHRAKDNESKKKLIKAIKETRAEARKQHGFIIGQTLSDVNDPLHVVVISSWQTEEDWKAWDKSTTRVSLLPSIEQNLSEPYTAVTMKDNVIWKEEIAHVF